MIVLKHHPPESPRLESVDTSVVERSDGRWGFGIWLSARTLVTPFAQLCDDLVESSREVPVDQLGQFIVARLRRWHELLDSANSGWSMSKLRGLIGELLMLDEASGVYGESEAVRAWRGPFHAAQDFALPELWLEVKATFPTARAVRITSADQLSAPGHLVLAVYTLTSLLPHESGITCSGLVNDIETRLRLGGLDDVADDFDRRLSALGYERSADYTGVPFRVEALHFYEVKEAFPRITPDLLAPGITAVAYDLEIGALLPFETGSPLQATNGPR